MVIPMALVCNLELIRLHTVVTTVLDGFYIIFIAMYVKVPGNH